MQQGEDYSVIVDGYSDGEGTYSLWVRRAGITPPSGDGTPPPPEGGAVEDVAAMQVACAQGTTLAEGRTTGTLIPTENPAVLSCGAGGRGPDAIYVVTVRGPTAVHLREESELDAVVELRAGCTAPHEVLACADDAPDSQHTGFDVSLDTGTYYLIVSAYDPGVGGAFTLDLDLTSIDRVPPREPPAAGAEGSP